ncbi:App1 family protein [Salegentibacter sp. JZCK2]|uniref:App1 family protein n=1 Tax=Salegentibacter tibetensis TaxID=2873600 RepID=UPI001CCFF64F|nr:App1 family protein [Salegentibacter tibetensis]MBZ9729343.1 App1 family protein [Salegentibacter tibetensis]
MKLDLKLYRGYVNNQELNVYGHLFKSWAPDKYRLDRKGLKHAVAIIHMFRISPLKNREITLKFQNTEVTTKTLDDGYFRFTIPFSEKLESGWHEYEVSCNIKNFGMIEKGELLKPHPSKYGIISDIDDTFLISHSNSVFRKLYVMLSRNIHRRKIFDDVVEHYKELSSAGQDSQQASNSFFYVSSSEWNLYEFINEFAKIHELPKAVIKLKKIKTGISDFLFTGRGSHDHKFEKIKDIISFYPNIPYVLLGDDSQKDAHIYERICKIFPKSLKAVYIRQTGNRQKPEITKILRNIESLGVSVCYFKHSNKAIKHSRDEGII